jgi:hypothetical protein
MNASCRICCHAANAFRPGLAVRTVFADRIGIRCASTASSKTQSQQQDDKDGSHNGVFNRRQRDASHRQLNLQSEDIAAILDKGTDKGTDKEIHQNEDSENLQKRVDEHSDPDAANEGDGVGLEALADYELEDLHMRTEVQPPRGSNAARLLSSKLKIVHRKKLAGQQKEVKEYQGVYIKPNGSYEIGQSLPWLDGLGTTNDSISRVER